VERAYELLTYHFGDLHWWPAESPLEVMVGAILTQNTAWRNVEKAIATLRQSGYLSLPELYTLPEEELALIIKSSGFYRVKARRLKALIRFIMECYAGDLERLFAVPAPRLREQLLALPGIGKETADSILLYAAGKPFFVIDAYTRRIVTRHGVAPGEATYDELQRLFMASLPPEVPIFNQYHALLVETGKGIVDGGHSVSIVLCMSFSVRVITGRLGLSR